jgi:hypothetical protein
VSEYENEWAKKRVSERTGKRKKGRKGGTRFSE